MAELAAAAALQEQQAVNAEGEDMGAEGEVDLDAEVPDADEAGGTESEEEEETTESEEDEDEDEEEEEEGNVTAEPSRFEGESMIEGSMVGGDGFSPARAERYLEVEDAELDGRAQDMRDLGVERDLDEEIPEAGSYEHTDTEEETSDSESEGCSEEEHDDNDSALPPSGAQSAEQSVLLDRSIDLTVEEMMDWSFVSYTRGNSARRARRSAGARRGRWSGGSDVIMGGSEADASPAVSAGSVMQRLRAARRNDVD